MTQCVRVGFSKWIWQRPCFRRATPKSDRLNPCRHNRITWSVLISDSNLKCLIVCPYTVGAGGVFSSDKHRLKTVCVITFVEISEDGKRIVRDQSA